METILRAIWRYRLAALCAACIALVIGGCQGPGAVAPVTVARLSALQVTGGERMSPAFDPGVLHYAVRCADGTALQVAADAEAEDATLRLLHDGSTGTGLVAGSVTVNGDHDIAIEVRDGTGHHHLRHSLHPARRTSTSRRAPRRCPTASC